MKNIKAIREKVGLSQSQLSIASGVNRRMIQSYEQGAKDINKAQAISVYKLSKALNVKIEDLLEI